MREPTAAQLLLMLDVEECPGKTFPEHSANVIAACVKRGWVRANRAPGIMLWSSSRERPLVESPLWLTPAGQEAVKASTE